MTGLFFVVDPVWWIGPIHISSLWIALSTGLVVWLYLWYRDRPRLPYPVVPKETYRYQPVDPNRDDYAELTLIEIRRYLAHSYQPRHSWAHTPSRIAEYTTDPRLVEIVEQLERGEYSKNKLTLGEQEDINRELSTKIKTKNEG